MYPSSNIKIYKGHIVYTQKFGEFTIVENGFIVVEGAKVKGVYKSLPEEYKNEPVESYGNRLIIPGFIDLHSHAPQLENRGVGIDIPLMDWLLVYTFKEEAKFKNLKYAELVYKEFAKLLIENGTTRSVLLGTIYKESTVLLLDIIAEAGLGGFVGKVNMDREAPEYYIENTLESLRDTEGVLRETLNRHKLVKPIVTPRFVPACTPKLMRGLGILASKYNVPVQSHLSEDIEEIEYVRKLHPEFKNYASIYNYFGLFGQQPTIMAHCVYVTDEEMELMAKNRVYVAHCPIANFNLSGSIAPIRKFIQMGVPVGLGTDVSAGHKISIKEVIWQAIQASYVKSTQTNKEFEPLKYSEAFYLATKGGGSFFGKVGSFEEGYEFDALVIDDSNLVTVTPGTIEERLERFIYIGDSSNIVERFVAGRKI